MPPVHTGRKASAQAEARLGDKNKATDRSSNTRFGAVYLAIDSKLPGCDVAAIKVDDVAPNGSAINRATVRQRKTGRPVRFELTEPARQTIEDYIKAAGKRPGEFLFSGRRPGHSMTTRQYVRLLSNWLVSVDLDPHLYSAHSLRRTK